MSLARGAMVQLQVVHALVMRETRTRFGAQQLGYLWALLEPLLWISTFLIAYSVMHRKVPFGMDALGFLATGVLPYQVFANNVGKIGEAINGNRGLLFYPHVKPL